ncbi:EF-hand domain-containing protein [Kitasatospora sp. MY 5-36]|uniref:EF-hand domain-containing protein n=1 Tax=Kitasatospora sp. MY 5-36 TaxID=1678027 RepID=UPI000670FC0E|nr:EF-hand domain-containing protein [Kitasatospora sp. MY 5-36]
MSDEAKRRIFAMLDTDGDDVISHDEYLARVDRAASAFGRGPYDPLVAAARATHEEVFRQMDGDGDGGVTFEEYRAWAGHEAFEETCRPALGSLFDLADGDGDGRVTRGEFARLRAASGNPPEGAAAAFDALDTGGEGTVERAVYLVAIHDFLTTGSSPMAGAYGDGRPGPREPAVR